MPIVNDDGRYVAWMSAATDLVADVTDANSQEDLLVRDMTAGSTALVSINRQRTGSANGYTFSDAKKSRPAASSSSTHPTPPIW